MQRLLDQTQTEAVTADGEQQLIEFVEAELVRQIFQIDRRPAFALQRLFQRCATPRERFSLLDRIEPRTYF